MLLRKVVMEGYRSLKGRQELLVDPQVTVLVGANDHGKTNVLAAIEALNDEEPLSEELNWDCEDPSHPKLEWHFELTKSDKEALAEAWLTEEAIHEDDEEESRRAATARCDGLTSVIFSRSGDDDDATVHSPDEDLPDGVRAQLLELRPTVELFAVSPKILDEVSRAQLDLKEYEFMKGIFMKAGLWELRDTLFVQDEQTSRQLENASRQLTDVLQREWEQGARLEWRFLHGGTEGNVIRLLVKDPAVQTKFVRPSRRSSGFTSFFFFGMTTHARTAENANQKFIFLFDEPGTYLHPIAQINLQRVFERLSARTQLLYSTHSMFLVNKNVPSRNRVIMKSEDGTVIDKKPFVRNWKAMRESLGIMLTHNWLIADRTVLVEGASDELYIIALLQMIVRAEAMDIDLNDLSIMQGGDSANMVAMACVMLGEGRKVVVLVDGDRHGKNALDDLKRLRQEEIASGDLKFVQLQAGFSIEDIVPKPELVTDATCAAAEELVAKGVREWSAGAESVTRRDVLRDAREARGNKTSGAVIVDVTASWLKPRAKDRKKEGVGKVNVALRYDEKLRALDVKPGDGIEAGAMAFAKQLVEALGLGSRKAEQRISE